MVNIPQQCQLLRVALFIKMTFWQMQKSFLKNMTSAKLRNLGTFVVPEQNEANRSRHSTNQKKKVGLKSNIDMGRGRVQNRCTITMDPDRRVRIHCNTAVILTRANAKGSATTKDRRRIFSLFGEAPRPPGRQSRMVYRSDSAPTLRVHRKLQCAVTCPIVSRHNGVIHRRDLAPKFRIH